ncbi:helix-turn-helix domain-containing protein [Flavihumibacter sp. UBA7668]|uniref:helix-turn-helix domain-containing protein n=1 Tax=Flavihumibacter sp. UBA7668 TaxID=1946542 RepID=UPI0025B9CA7D|nr:helix-turn-helix domain-containing protein [Flavihumibacter sp. UBA7668]
MNGAYTYHVKNMVCERCIVIVKNILSSLQIEAKLALGKISVAQKLMPSYERGLVERLRSVGLDLIESRVSLLIEGVKQAVRDYIALGIDARQYKLSGFISSRLSYDFGYLSDLFSKEEEITIERYYILQRMEKVKELIAHDQLTLSEISYETGFSSVHHLSAQFKKFTGLTPSQYKAAGNEINQTQTIAILMADLSGYSALTETHGAISAADLIDKYVEIVQDCLIGDSRLVERVGDEVMIVSNSPDHLLATADLIIKKTSKVNNFLRVHGGLHYGEVVQRNNSYFGSAINLTSRIAKKASPGTFWCSGEFVDALQDKVQLSLTPLGKHSFKNFTEEKNIIELSSELHSSIYVDPVCHMLILNKETAVKHPSDEHYFCSAECLQIHKSAINNSITFN